MGTLSIEGGKPQKIPFRSLSDGYQGMVFLVADLAYRAIRLNPHLGERAVLDTGGVVLIDEIDMHLHPEWQRHVVNDLKKAFPKMQFIMTTHSPFIVQSLNAGEVINLDGTPLAADPNKRSLEENALYMGVEDTQSDQFIRKEQLTMEYLKLVEEGEKMNKEPEKRLQLEEKLDELLTDFSDDPVLVAKLKLKKMAALGK